jgi:hypothetical protein
MKAFYERKYEKYVLHLDSAGHLKLRKAVQTLEEGDIGRRQVTRKQLGISL